MNGVKSGVVPASDESIVDEGFNLALAQHSVTDVQARVLPHIWLVDVEILEKLIVGFAADLELKGAKGVCDVLERVYQAVSVVIGGIDTPLVT